MTADAFAGRLFGAATASLELATVYLGDRLGLYRALAMGGVVAPETVLELAAEPGVLRGRDRRDRARDAAVLRAALNLASTRRRGSQR
jgi:hypothetical protein